jgi:hypothetical protein
VVSIENDEVTIDGNHAWQA